MAIFRNPKRGRDVTYNEQTIRTTIKEGSTFSSYSQQRKVLNNSSPISFILEKHNNIVKDAK